MDPMPPFLVGSFLEEIKKVKSKTFIVTIISIVVLLIGSLAISTGTTSFNERGNSTTTEHVTETETKTQSVNVTQTIEKSISLGNLSSRDIDILNNEKLTTTVTKTIIQKETIEADVNFGNSYILVGGQNGTWFTKSQFPRLFQISPAANVSLRLNPLSGQGTIWSGSYDNGSHWLVSGWGIGSNPGAPNPFLYVYNGSSPLEYSINEASEAEWKGGDIFAASSNGTSWFVSGMGSGVLNPSINVSPVERPMPSINHLSAGLFDRTNFLDLSTKIPIQMDGMLYANANNGAGWLVGGGYLDSGVLFWFNGTAFTSLTPEVASEVPEFHSVQSIAWNGQYWLVGGFGFLAKYDGSHFTDLTKELTSILLPRAVASKLFSVNSIAWNGSSWLLGGGDPVAIGSVASSVWLATYNSQFFLDLTSRLPAGMLNTSSSVLSISYSQSGGYWIVGGYSNGKGMLVEYGNIAKDISGLLKDTTYVDWVGAT